MLDTMIGSVFDRHELGQVDLVVGLEARGFLFGVPIADALNAGFSMARKPGKLPIPAIEESYSLEYGTNTLQMGEDAVQPGQRVLIVDDLLATGGTALAAARLVDRLGGKVVGALFLIELVSLEGRTRLQNAGIPVCSVLKYD